MKNHTGTEYIAEFAGNLTSKAGVYRMFDAGDKVLYVGKAKNLKNRVTTYATKGALPTRILQMVAKTVKMEVIITGSEAEALLLEASLIKKLNPIYNILLKDDKSYPFIEFTNHQFPQIRKTRGAKSKKNKYYGPFASVGALNQTLEILQKAFLLRPCSDSVFANRSRPCLQYQIKRCSAPCMADKISPNEYDSLISQAQDFLSGKSRDIQEKLAVEMQQHSEMQEYERAGQCRDRIEVLTRIQQEQAISNINLGDCDIIGLHMDGGKCCVQIFFFRSGQSYGNRAFFPSIGGVGRTEAEIISSIIGQFYQNHLPPKNILLSHQLESAEQELIAEALSLKADYQVNIAIPKQGKKLQSINNVVENAKNALSLRVAERTESKKQMTAIAKIFGMEKPPERIEIYDNSHISGTNAVGAMVVATADGFDKKSYRRFNFRDEMADGDDYAMMREMLTRRLANLKKDKNNDTPYPDLLLIDGGKGQLSVVSEVMLELEIDDIIYVGIAKGVDRNAGREQFFMVGKQPFGLPTNDPVLYYLQRLRDEAHRFAITSHRVKRSRDISKSELDNIVGIGKLRKKSLLNHFGSVAEIKKATLEELEKVKNINKKTARLVFDFFHG